MECARSAKEHSRPVARCYDSQESFEFRCQSSLPLCHFDNRISPDDGSTETNIKRPVMCLTQKMYLQICGLTLHCLSYPASLQFVLQTVGFIELRRVNHRLHRPHFNNIGNWSGHGHIVGFLIYIFVQHSYQSNQCA